MLFAAAALLCPAVFASAYPAGMADPQETQAPAPIERRPPPRTSGSPAVNPYPARENPVSPNHRETPTGLPRGEHLAQWMSLHSSLSPEQQQEALGREPGFSNLPSETQQRYRDRLSQLDAMRPEQRQHVLARTEALERLSPEQRTEWRGAMSQLGALPQDERRVVSQTFHALRVLPQEQQIPALNSGRFGPPLNPMQRTVLFELLRVEPILNQIDETQRRMSPQASPGMPGGPGIPGTAPVYPGPR